ncbi:hypothetical protein [Gracilibacillus saliphilus]|uniref:hypothetical protein n=1 Tax=Gracilibacillus saliphilus TaxID=543890 RepID=UPI0013D38660|nr:hypothetical protein [Gracilibacillus saliphilus]
MKRAMMITCLFMLCACGQGEDATNDDNNAGQAETEAVLYENDVFQIEEIDGWSVDEEATAEQEQNVIFSNGTTRLIVSIVSKEQTIDILKKDVLASFSKKVELIEDDENYIALITNRKENIRGDVYFHQGSEHQLIFTYMTPEQHYQESKNQINAFNEGITIF